MAQTGSVTEFFFSDENDDRWQWKEVRRTSFYGVFLKINRGGEVVLSGTVLVVTVDMTGATVCVSRKESDGELNWTLVLNFVG